MDPVADSCGFALVEPFIPLFLGNVSQSILPHVRGQVPLRMDGEVEMPIKFSKLYAYVILFICTYTCVYMHTVTKKIDLIVTTLYPQAMFGYVRSNTHLEGWGSSEILRNRLLYWKTSYDGLCHTLSWFRDRTRMGSCTSSTAEAPANAAKMVLDTWREWNSKIFKELHLFRRSPYSDHVLTEEIRSRYTFVTWITRSHGSNLNIPIWLYNIYQCIQRVHIQRIYVYLVLSLVSTLIHLRQSKILAVLSDSGESKSPSSSARTSGGKDRGS